MNKVIRDIGYKVTFEDRHPFGEVTMRFWEPKNIVGRLCSWYEKNNYEMQQMQVDMRRKG